jgi:hypothetical protein
MIVELISINIANNAIWVTTIALTKMNIWQNFEELLCEKRTERSGGYDTVSHAGQIIVLDCGMLDFHRSLCSHELGS